MLHLPSLSICLAKRYVNMLPSQIYSLVDLGFNTTVFGYKEQASKFLHVASLRDLSFLYFFSF